MAAAAAAASAQPAVDTAALQVWCARTDGRLDAADTAITGVGLHLEATVGQAKDAMNAIVQDVRVELGFQQQVRIDHQQLNNVVAATQQKFAEVEGSLNHVAQGLAVVQGLAAQLAQVEARAARAEQRMDQLTAISLASAPPLGTPQSTPPPSPSSAGDAGGAARFDPGLAARADPWQAGQAAAAAQAPAPAPLPPQLQPPGITQAMPNSTQFYGIGTPTPQQHDFKVDNRSWGDNRRLDLVAAPDAYLVWRDRALGHLCRDRPDVRKLLVWAESQSKE